MRRPAPTLILDRLGLHLSPSNLSSCIALMMKRGRGHKMHSALLWDTHDTSPWKGGVVEITVLRKVTCKGLKFVRCTCEKKAVVAVLFFLSSTKLRVSWKDQALGIIGTYTAPLLANRVSLQQRNVVGITAGCNSQVWFTNVLPCLHAVGECESPPTHTRTLSLFRPHLLRYLIALELSPETKLRWWW